MDLILPITLGVCLIASQKKSVMGEDYHHPVLLLVLGIVVVVVSGYLGITSLSSLSALLHKQNCLDKQISLKHRSTD